MERFDLGDEFVACGVERVEVAEAGFAAGGHDHALEAVGHDGADVVAQDVAGLGGDHLGGFEHLGGGGVLLLEEFALVVGEPGEPAGEHVVHLRCAGDGGVGGLAFVEDRHGRAVGFGLGERVPVEVAAEDLEGLLALAHDDRRAGEPDACRVGERRSSSWRAAPSRASGAPRRPSPGSSSDSFERAERLSLPDSPSPPPLSVSRYFWIIAITTPGPGWLSSSFTSLALRATLIVSPVSAAVSLSWSCRSVRSVTSTILKRRSSGWLRIARMRNTIVRLLPDPWVCHTIPPRRSTCPSTALVVPVSIRLIALLHAPVLLIAGDELDRRARVELHEQREVPDDVEQPLGRQHPGGQRSPAASTSSTDLPSDTASSSTVVGYGSFHAR